MSGVLIAFEGLDQSGKETQARMLAARLTAAGGQVRIVSFPDYATPIGTELHRALHGEREYGPDVIQMLMIANRYEWKPAILQALAEEQIVVADRYLASSVAYGEALATGQGVGTYAPGSAAAVEVEALAQESLALLKGATEP